MTTINGLDDPRPCFRSPVIALLSAALLLAPQAAQDAGDPLRVEGTALVDGVGQLVGDADAGGLFLLRGSAVIDGQLWGWPGFRVNATALATGGADPARFVGDLQQTSNIAAPASVWPYEAWVQQNIGSRVSVLAGIYDVNSEFDVIDAAGLFINSSFGIGADLGLSGPNGPAIFPATGLAVRLAGAPSRRIRVRVVAADGTPGDPGDPGRFDPAWRDGDGVLLAAEAVVHWADLPGLRRPPQGGRRLLGRGGGSPPPTRVGIGVWGYRGVAASGEPARGAYLLAETRALDAGRGARSLRLFGRAGAARQGPVRAFVSAGTRASGPLPSRPDDELGLGVAVAWPDQEGTPAAAGSDLGPEGVVELSYRVNVATWLFVQPDIQYVVNPIYADGRETALVLITRIGLLH